MSTGFVSKLLQTFFSYENTKIWELQMHSQKPSVIESYSMWKRQEFLLISQSCGAIFHNNGAIENSDQDRTEGQL